MRVLVLVCVRACRCELQWFSGRACVPGPRLAYTVMAYMCVPGLRLAYIIVAYMCVPGLRLLGVVATARRHMRE